VPGGWRGGADSGGVPLPLRRPLLHCRPCAPSGPTSRLRSRTLHRNGAWGEPRALFVAQHTPRARGLPDAPAPSAPGAMRPGDLRGLSYLSAAAEPRPHVRARGGRSLRALCTGMGEVNTCAREADSSRLCLFPCSSVLPKLCVALCRRARPCFVTPSPSVSASDRCARGAPCPSCRVSSRHSFEFRVFAGTMRTRAGNQYVCRTLRVRGCQFSAG
jgi:hypothetical protein